MKVHLPVDEDGEVDCEEVVVLKEARCCCLQRLWCYVGVSNLHCPNLHPVAAVAW